MKVKDIIEIINVFNAKIIFDKPEDVKNDIMLGRSPLYFTPVEGKEKKKYETIIHNQEFESTTAAIHVIDLSVRDLVNIFECDGTGIHEFTNNIIDPYCDAEISRDIVYVIFLFLHEIGHWMQFECMNKKVKEFINKDLQLAKENFDKVSELKRQRQQRIEKGSKCILTAKEKRLFREYMQEYRNIPKEKEADEFALSQMQLSLELYKNGKL